MISKTLAEQIINFADREALANFAKDIVFNEIETHSWADDTVNKMLELIAGGKYYSVEDIDVAKVEEEVKRCYKGDDAKDIKIIGVHTCSDTVNVAYKAEDEPYSTSITLTNVLK